MIGQASSFTVMVKKCSPTSPELGVQQKVATGEVPLLLATVKEPAGMPLFQLIFTLLLLGSELFTVKHNWLPTQIVVSKSLVPLIPVANGD